MPGTMLGSVDLNINKTWPPPPRNLEPMIRQKCKLNFSIVYFLAFSDIL